MIFGIIDIDPVTRAIHTHRDSYLLDGVTVVSVRRPLLAAGFAVATGSGGFGAVFGDLLYPGEVAVLVGIAAMALILGLKLGQLRLLSRDLRGSELSGAIWGGYAALNRKRLEIARAIRADGPPAPHAGPPFAQRGRSS